MSRARAAMAQNSLTQGWLMVNVSSSDDDAAEASLLPELNQLREQVVV
jgi:hypothetical protein